LSTPTPQVEKLDGGREEIAASRKRWILILSEAAVVVGLLLAWFMVEGVQESTSLWVLFLYSFPSEFLVGLIPHEPVLIFYGTHHAPLVVAAVAGVSTVMAEGLNYHFFGLFYSMPALRGALQREGVKKIADFFNKAPFFAILFCAFSPVPFFPVRFLVVITGYPVWKYLLGVLISRTPRFYLLALLGALFEVPGWALAAFFLVMLLVVNFPAVSKILSSPTIDADLWQVAEKGVADPPRRGMAEGECRT
jgi:membrane protein YqaA with SNARE-associated domain